MNKKGLSHVDWVMSMGIFLVYVLFMIIMIKPGSGPVYQGESLLDLVEFHFREAFSATIEKIPLFVSGSSGCKLDVILPEGVSGVTLTNDPINLDGTDKVPYSGSLSIQDSYSDGKTYWMIYSDEINIKDNYASLPSPDYTSCDSAIYSFGSEEILNGFSTSKVVDFFGNKISDCKKYETVKGLINYPPDSEFQFFIYDALNTPPTILHKYNCIEPGQQDNVYVREFGTVILNEDLTVRPIIINLRVW